MKTRATLIMFTTTSTTYTCYIVLDIFYLYIKSVYACRLSLVCLVKIMYFFQVDQIQAQENTFNVKVTIENRKPKKFIRIQGLKADTSQANVKISEIFRRVEVADVKKSQESLIAKMVQTFDVFDAF